MKKYKIVSLLLMLTLVMSLIMPGNSVSVKAAVGNAVDVSDWNYFYYEIETSSSDRFETEERIACFRFTAENDAEITLQIANEGEGDFSVFMARIGEDAWFDDDGELYGGYGEVLVWKYDILEDFTDTFEVNSGESYILEIELSHEPESAKPNRFSIDMTEELLACFVEEEISLDIGKTSILQVENLKDTVTWKSTNTKVATVNSAGKVTAKDCGTCDIVCTLSGGRKLVCKVTVTDPAYISKSEDTIYVGASTTLKIEGTKKKITWESSNTDVATVSTKGKVTAKAKGTAIISASVGTRKYTCKITVKNPALNSTKISLNLGEKFKLTLAGAKATAFKSANPKVAAVSQKGVIVAKAQGETKISVVADNGKTYKCTVSVTEEAE